jgi:hypothetical protein
VIIGKQSIIKEVSPEVKIFETKWSDDSVTYQVQKQGVNSVYQHLDYMVAFQEAIKGGK